MTSSLQRHDNAIHRVLVLGGTGMLGHKLLQVLGASPKLQVHATVRANTPPIFAAHAEAAAIPVQFHTGINLNHGSDVLRTVLENVRPDVIVNAIGAIKQRDLYTATDDTFYVNATFPHLLPLLNPNPNGRVVHISTDCVYQGDRGGYREIESPDALDLYGRSKACGELAYGPHLTLRTSIIGFELDHGLGLLSWLFRQPLGSRLPGYSRAIYSGLPTVTLARVILQLIEAGLPLRGLYHVASEPITKLDLLTRISREFGLGHTFLPDESVAIDRSLDDTVFRTVTGTSRPSWKDLVEELKVDYNSQPYQAYYTSHRMASV